MDSLKSEVSRRAVLRGAGALLALPYLESLAGAAANAKQRPVRFVGMYHTNGVNPYKWYPADAGRSYTMPENLALLKDVRSEMTVCSGLAHWRAPQSAGHSGVSNLLTGVGNGKGKRFTTSVSLDQYLAPHIGRDTRYESLVLSWRSGVGNLGSNIHTMSFGQLGNPIPAESSPQKVFERLFVEPSVEAKQRIRDLQSRDRSILDGVMTHAKSVKQRLGKRDQQKVDDYLTNVRSVEKEMVREAKWLDTPRPQIDPKTGQIMQEADTFDFDVMIELIYLALTSDTTRIITFVPMGEGGSYHSTSHWNQNPESKLPEMDKWDRKWIGGLAKLAGKLKETQEGDGTFLDRTCIIYGGGHGRRPHYSHDLPVVLVGGNDLGFKHGQHLAFAPLVDEETDRNRPENGNGSADFASSRGEIKKTPLANIFVSVADAMGVPTDRFADSTGGLEELF